MNKAMTMEKRTTTYEFNGYKGDYYLIDKKYSPVAHRMFYLYESVEYGDETMALITSSDMINVLDETYDSLEEWMNDNDLI